MILNVLLAVRRTVAVVVTRGEAAGVDVLGEDVFCGFGVEVGLLLGTLVDVFPGVRKVSFQGGGVKIPGRIGSMTSAVLLSAMYCALGSNFEPMLACTFHCGARLIASVPVRHMQTSPSSTIARNNIQSRFRR
jgi:hypothetical protein